MTRATVVRTMAVGASAAALAACVLLDPPATLPIVQESPPYILSGVEPPEGVLVRWPTEFVIPIYVLDSAQSVQWLAFEDYNPLATGPSGEPVFDKPYPVPPGDGGVELARITSLPAPTGPGCHTVAIVIADGFAGWTPVASSGAIVQWLYVPSGNPGECAAYDAGWLVDATFPSDAKSDANSSDGGV